MRALKLGNEFRIPVVIVPGPLLVDNVINILSFHAQCTNIAHPALGQASVLRNAVVSLWEDKVRERITKDVATLSSYHAAK